MVASHGVWTAWPGWSCHCPGRIGPIPPYAGVAALRPSPASERDQVLRGRLADGDSPRHVAGEPRQVGVVLGVDRRLLVGQVVVQRRPSRGRNRRLNRRILIGTNAKS